MKITDDDLRAVWQERSDDEPADCLTDTAWMHLLSSEAGPAERARAASHIASCSACADQYRLLQPLQSWEADINRVFSKSPVERVARWTGWRWSPSPRLAVVAVAATLLLASQVVTLSQLVVGRREKVQLETQLAENSQRLATSQRAVSTLQERLQTETSARELDEAQLQAPQLDVAIVDLAPQGAGVVRGSSAPQIVNVAANALSVTLVLNFPPLVGRAVLEIEIVDAAGKVRWTGRTQHERDTTGITLALPIRTYPAGAYVIHVTDVTRGRKPLTLYPVVIRQTPERS